MSDTSPHRAWPSAMAVGMRVTARCDQAVRAAVELAARRRPATGEDLALALRVSLRSLHATLTQLTRSGLLVSQRGAHGGYQLARPAHAVTVADVVRAVDGALGADGSDAPADGNGPGILGEVWNALRASELAVLDAVTLADLAAGHLPESVRTLLVATEFSSPR